MQNFELDDLEKAIDFAILEYNAMASTTSEEIKVIRRAGMAAMTEVYGKRSHTFYANKVRTHWLNIIVNYSVEGQAEKHASVMGR